MRICASRPLWLRCCALSQWNSKMRSCREMRLHLVSTLTIWKRCFSFRSSYTTNRKSSMNTNSCENSRSDRWKKTRLGRPIMTLWLSLSSCTKNGSDASTRSRNSHSCMRRKSSSRLTTSLSRESTPVHLSFLKLSRGKNEKRIGTVVKALEDLSTAQLLAVTQAHMRRVKKEQLLSRTSTCSRFT